ncbi:MAG: maleylpyruvate isomerase family mycothiol-dependent enzyme [Acidimicrobiales bacterium]
MTTMATATDHNRAASSPQAMVELLQSQYKSLDFLGSSLTSREWHAPAAVPGWSVFDVYAHIIGVESMLEGYELPYVKIDVSKFDHVRNELGVFNETWIESLSHLGDDALLDRYRRVTAARIRTLSAMTDGDFDVEVDSVLGSVPYRRLLRFRLFDCWMHEQDIREGLGRPGHESGPCARAALDTAADALGSVVAAEAGGRPRVVVRLVLTGPIRRRVEVDVVEGHATVTSRVGEDAGTVADASISMTSSLFMRLAGGRSAQLSPRLGTIDFDGDLDLATRVATNLAITS